MTKKKKPYVVVRTYSAGVHYGTLESQKGKQVVLSNARRVWYWKGAFTLHELAEHGASANGSKISCAVKSITLTEGVEVIQTSAAGEKCLRALPEFRP